MKIWIDILTPKQLLFFEPIVRKLRKNHQVLCTSRAYSEVSKLAKIRGFRLVIVGKHESDTRSKLGASIERMKKLSHVIEKFSPDLTISFCSPEAARIAFGLGIRHVAFCDSPHANAVMRLTLPLIQNLLIPWIIPKTEFTKFGIEKKNIITYKAIDAALTIKRESKSRTLWKNSTKKNIVIRMEEEQAAYATKSSKIIPLIKEITRKFQSDNIIVLARYPEQIQRLEKKFGKKIRVMSMSYDGKAILDNTDLFIGSGGTMTAEAALLGVPTISYNAVPNIIENYLVKNNFIVRETDPKKIITRMRNLLRISNKKRKVRAAKFVGRMEDPYRKLADIL